MKLLLLAALIVPLSLAAAPISGNDAMRAAETRLLRDGMDGHAPISASVVDNGREPLAWLIELEPAGYVITSADDALPPVIAYSYSTAAESGEYPSILLNMVRRDLSMRLEWLRGEGSELAESNRLLWEQYLSGTCTSMSPGLTAQWPPAGSTPTGGWLLENWTQNAPYNQLCPMDLIAGSRSVAGCPAVAMGSILNLGGQLNGTEFDDSDDYYHNYHEYYWIDDDHAARDFPSWPELNVYLDTLQAHYDGHLTITDTDKAALVYACGAACTQVYTASVSGTFGVDQAYDAYLRFGFDDCELLYASSDSLYERLSQNMISGMPAHLAVVDSGPTYGHNLVIDGYNTDDFYHLNFGWGGAYNGWYDFPLSGMPYSMNIIEGIILDIGEGVQGVETEGTTTEAPGLILTSSGNPAASSTVLGLTLQSSSMVTLTVHDISGRTISNLHSGELQPGTHSFTWDTGNAPPGVYFAAASGETGSACVRMTILR